MTRMHKGIVPALVLVAALVALSGVADTATADSGLLVYPRVPTVFRYDTSRYELVSPAHPAFDGYYAIGNAMLWDRVEQRLPVEIYRCEEILGFEPSPNGRNEFVVLDNEFTLVVDGFSGAPRTYNNLYIRFMTEPVFSHGQLKVDGEFIDSPIHPIPSLTVSTPIGDGYYSDDARYHIRWSGGLGVRITVFSDRNNNRVFDHGEVRYSILSEENAVSVEEGSWGAVKAKYRGE